MFSHYRALLWIVLPSCCSFSIRNFRLKARAIAASTNSFINEDDRKDDHLTRRFRLESGKEIRIKSRTVRITDTLNITVWEWENPASMVETYWQVWETRTVDLDPFGLVSWPGSVVAAQELLRKRDKVIHPNTTVLVIGSGLGIEAQMVAMLGAKSCLATDVHPTTLQLLRYAAEQAKLDIETQLFDIFSTDPLPDCNVMVVADVMYSEQLAAQIGRRCWEAVQRNTTVLVSDSQRFADFLPELNKRLVSTGRLPLEWEPRYLANFTGSGVMIDEDQTYDVKARVLWANLQP